MTAREVQTVNRIDMAANNYGGEILRCKECGAEARNTQRERPRFLKRHGLNCQKRKRTEFNQRLAAGTRSTEPTTFEEHKELNAN